MPTEDEIVKAQYGLERGKLQTLRAEVTFLNPTDYQKPGRAAKGDEEPASPMGIRRMVFERKTLAQPWEYRGTESPL
jgi:hypothetical protein